MARQCTLVSMGHPTKTDRAAILVAAMKQVDTGGVEKLAIRSVATTLGLAPNALYHYFDSLAALQEALAEESRRLLLEKMEKAAGRREPVPAIRAIAQAYIRFAREHPAIFSLTLRPSGNDGDDNAAHLRSWQFVLGQVSRLYGEKRAPEATLALWAFLHGMTLLQQAGVFGKMKPASSFAFGLEIWIEAASH
jgi:AcrR family transcriptional regulator